MKVRLTEQQQAKKKWIIEELGDTYSKLDEPIVDMLAFALDMVEMADARMNDVPALMSDKVYMASRQKLVGQVNDCYKMLGLAQNQRKKTTEEVDELDGIL